MADFNLHHLDNQVDNLKKRGVYLPKHQARARLAANDMHREALRPGALREALTNPKGDSQNSDQVQDMEQNNRMIRSMRQSRSLKKLGFTPTGGGGGASDIGAAIPRFYDPLEYWDLSGLPWNTADEGHRHKLHKWMRLYYSTHWLIPALIDIFTKFPLIGMNVKSKDPKIQDFYESLFMDQLDYPNFLVSLGREYWLTGDAYPLGSFDEDLGIWEHEELLNPEDITIENFPFLNSRQLKIVPPDYLPLSVDTSVLLGSGQRKRLGDIEVGDGVVTHRGRSRVVKAVHQQGVLPGLAITTHSGRRVESGLEHPFLTPSGWISAQDLKIGNVLAISIPETMGISERPLEEFRLAGYFVGDGCVAKNKGSCFSQIASWDPVEAADFFVCADVMGFGCRQSTAKGNGQYYYNIIAGERSVKNWLREISLFGTISHTKRVPSFVFEGSQEQISHYVGAYFACDGTIRPRSKGRSDAILTFTSVNRDLLADTQHLLARLGIRSRLRCKILKEGTQGYGQVGDAYWNLELSSQDDVARFVDRIFVVGKKAARLRESYIGRSAFDHAYIPDPIVSIEPLEGIDCRCLTVEDDESFLAEDLVVHNTKLVQEKSPAKEFKMLKENYPELIPYLLKNEHIPISEVLLKQLANKVNPWDDHGTPILLRGLRWLIHEEKLLASQDAIAERLYSPLILAKMGVQDLGDGYGAWMPSQDELEIFRDDLDLALSSDFRLLVHHFGLEVENVFGREQMPRLQDDFDLVQQRLMLIFGVNPTLLQAGSNTQPYASSALQAEFLNQTLKTFQHLLQRHFKDRAAVVAEAHEHYDYETQNNVRIPKMEEVIEYDDDGKKKIVEKPKLIDVDLEFSVLDMRDEATERQFMQTLRQMGVPIPDQKLMVGVEDKIEDYVDEYNTELTDKTIQQQEAKLKTYIALKERKLPVPPDLDQEIQQMLMEEAGVPPQQQAPQPGSPGGGGAGAPPGGPGGAGHPPGSPIVMPPPPPGMGGPPGGGLGPGGQGGPVPGGGPPPAGPVAPGPGGATPQISNERRPGMPQASKLQRAKAALEWYERGFDSGQRSSSTEDTTQDTTQQSPSDNMSDKSAKLGGLQHNNDRTVDTLPRVKKSKKYSIIAIDGDEELDDTDTNDQSDQSSG